MLTVKLFRKIFAAFVAIFISLGWLTGPSTSEPIKFSNSDKVKLSFALVSDTHVLGESVTEFRFESLFKDLSNSGERFNAVVIAGDLTELGVDCEYENFFKVLDRQTVTKNLILATGNHDVRYAYKKNKPIIMNKVEEYLGIDTKGESFYSYDVNGYTFIVMGTEKQVFERAYISDKQLAFVDSELQRATAEGKPAFVVCHQALANTHGLPEVWKTGDLGDQSQQLRDILVKYKNVFFLNGHLHDGMYERSFEKLADGVYSINLPTYGKSNDFGVKEKGTGYYVEVYDNQVIFTGRNFLKGHNVDKVEVFDLI